LVRQGMKRSYALQEVLGCVELARRGPPRHEEAESQDDWQKHDLACECIDCSAPGPQYARPYEGVVA
jgi:hypothetical protein